MSLVKNIVYLDMLRFGNITEIDAEKGRARVHFEEDDIVSDWLPMVVKSSRDNKHESWYDVGDFVSCLMDKNVEDGVIIGAIYDDNNLPPIGNKDIEAKTFSDGTVVQYDRSSHTYSIELGEGGSAIVKSGTTEHKITESGHTVKRGSETVKKILEDLIDAILAETHPTAVGPTGPPINAAVYQAIKARIPTLFES